MLVPNDQACDNQFSSTTPIPASETAAGNAWVTSLQQAVANAQQASDALLVANPWESWAGGFNLMKDIQRGNTQVALPGGAGVPSGPPQLPGLPPAGQGGSLWDRWKRNLGYRNGGNGGNRAGGGNGGGNRGNPGAIGGPYGSDSGGGSGGGNGTRSGNARQGSRVRGWNTRFVAGPGGKFQTWPAGATGGPGDSTNAATIDCTVEPADVVPSDGILPPGAPEVQVSTPPAGPALRTDQPTNIVVMPPAAYAPCSPPPRTGNLCADLKSGAVFASSVTAPTLYACSKAGYAGVGPTLCAPGPAAGMGEWSASIAQPGAVPAMCATGAAAQKAGPAGFPWWLWALAGIAVVAVASTETKTRRSSGGQKRAA